jgi:hypothetical protein
VLQVNEMVKVSVGIDVPSLEKGVGFYSAAFVFSKVAEPYPGVTVRRSAGCLVSGGALDNRQTMAGNAQ